MTGLPQDANLVRPDRTAHRTSPPPRGAAEVAMELRASMGLADRAAEPIRSILATRQPTWPGRSGSSVKLCFCSKALLGPSARDSARRVSAVLTGGHGAGCSGAARAGKRRRADWATSTHATCNGDWPPTMAPGQIGVRADDQRAHERGVMAWKDDGVAGDFRNAKRFRELQHSCETGPGSRG